MAVAREFPLRFFGDRFVDFQRVIVKEFLARSDIAHRVDEDAVVFLDRFAVRVAGMVDPSRRVSTDLGVDYLAVIEAEIECVRIVLVVRSAVPGDALAGVLDDAGALGNELGGVNTATVHAGFANFGPSSWLSSPGFFRHRGDKIKKEGVRIKKL